MRNVLFVSLLLASFLVGAGAIVLGPVVVHSQGPSQGQVEIGREVKHDVSPPLGDINPQTEQRGKREKPIRQPHGNGPAATGDPVRQTAVGPLVGTTAGLNFAGVGNGDYGFSPNAAPPDTNGAVGATQYVQWVNESFAVFNKSTGALVYGPVAGNTLWSGFGGGCQANNDGDPIVQYDKAANRWVFTQFSVTTTPYLQCVAVSTSSDATGSYNRYAFTYGNTQFPDYPKLGVWTDAYFISFNIFNNGVSFAGAKACAYDRNAMLAGAVATQVCFQLSPSYGGLLPSDLDGSNAPPTGSPNFFLNFGTNSLNLWKFHVDFLTPTNSTFSGPTNIPVAAFAAACSGGTCIPQSGTNQKLDSLADRLMYRLAYRHFSDGHEALVVNHSVDPGNGTSGIRWYEIRNPNGTPGVFQQGTFAPDSAYRWMGSIAMDQAGDIAVGYSLSSSSIFPSIRYTGRVPSDVLGTMEAENTLLTGGGSQLPTLSRWGDYSAMSIDPVDDCTFFFTTEYLKASGTFNWSTRIASFKFPSCGSGPTAPAPPTLSASAGNALVHLSWTTPSNGGSAITGYNIYRGTSPSSEGTTPYASATATANAYDDSLVTNGTRYYYKVSAVNGVGESAQSNEASATPTALSVPSAPQKLTATRASRRGVQLSWSAPASSGSSAITNYRIYRSTSAGGETLLITVGNVTSYSDTGTKRGVRYYYKATAVNSFGDSPASNEASAIAR
jgi:Fibronectin type III domain